MRKPTSRPLFALSLMLAATASFVAMQAGVKFARQAGFSTVEVMFMRTAPGLPLLWYLLRRNGHGLKPQAPKNLLVRSLFGSLAMVLNFASMQKLSLAQFSTLGLSQPVFVALASPLFLREPVRAATWLAMALSGAGAWLLLDPLAENRSVPLFPALFALGSALASAVAHIWVRIAAEQDPPERVVFHFSAWVSIGSLAMGLVEGRLTQLPVGVSRTYFVLLVLALSGFGTLGQVLMTRAYVHAEAAKVSIVGYASIALAMLVDLVFWDLSPSSGAVLGGALMVAGGVALVRNGVRIPKRA